MRQLGIHVRQQGNILIIESDDLIRGLLERWLGEAGYAVAARTLHTLTDDRVWEGPPHLVIADVPSPRGVERVIQSVRGVYPSPILVLSARFRRGLGASMDVASRLGVRNILPKPFTRKELLFAVSESLERS
jgi:DNA-binding response OmpR family regulator